jgi:TPR repeat protein
MTHGSWKHTTAIERLPTAMTFASEPQQDVRVQQHEAQHNLGVMYLYGRVVRQDYQAALKWCRLAAKQNVADSQRASGVTYQNGHGVQADRVEAIAWYLKAADQGNELAKHDSRAMGIDPWH